MNEFEFIKRIAEGVPRTAEGLLQGIDDDCAVIEGPRDTCWLVTTDVLTEGVHFKREWADFMTLGEKALLVNISDIAAMGGVPWFYFVSIGCPKNISSDDLNDLFEGMKAVSDKNDMILAGGDTTASDSGLFISITVIGSAERDKIIYRSGAKAGDKIFVSGSLGGSSAGLECLKKNLSGENHSDFIDKHLLPEPRISLGAWLAKNGCASAMIDVSDGLVADLGHIADVSGVGFKVRAGDVPAEIGLNELAAGFDLDPMEFVLSGGEDYELLFTMNADQEKRFFEQSSREDFGCTVTHIGEIITGSKKRLILDEGGKEINITKFGFVHEIGKSPP